MPRRYLVLLFLLLALLAVLAACRDQATPTAVSTTAALPTATEEPPATIPPVASPTIIIPEVTKEPETPEATADAEPAPEVSLSEMPKFAQYRLMPSEVVPAMYHEPIAPDLSNVLVSFVFSPD